MPPGDVLGPLMLEYWHTGEQDLETEWSPRQALSASPQFSPSFDHGQDHNYTSIPTSHGLPRWCYVKILPANAGDVRDADLTPGLGRSLEEGMATHSSIFAWRIPMDRGAWWSTFHRVTKNWTQLRQLQRSQWHPTLVLLPGKSHGWRSLVGCSPWGP